VRYPKSKIIKFSQRWEIIETVCRVCLDSIITQYRHKDVPFFGVKDVCAGCASEEVFRVRNEAYLLVSQRKTPTAQARRRAMNGGGGGNAAV